MNEEEIQSRMVEFAFNMGKEKRDEQKELIKKAFQKAKAKNIEALEEVFYTEIDKM